MARIRVAQKGYNAQKDGVEHMLIDSDYQNILIYTQGNGTWTSTGSGQEFPLETPYTDFIQTITLIVEGPGSANPSTSNYYYQIVKYSAGDEGLIPPGASVTYPSQWVYVSGGVGTISYMYYLYYLSSSAAVSGVPSSAYLLPLNKSPYINVGEGNNVESASILNLAWTSQIQSLQIVNQTTFNISGAISGSTTFTFTNPVGYVTPFMAIVENYTPPIGNSSSISASSLNNFDTIEGLFGDYISINDSSIYYYYNDNGTNLSNTLDFNVTLYFLIPPTQP